MYYFQNTLFHLCYNTLVKFAQNGVRCLYKLLLNRAFLFEQIISLFGTPSFVYIKVE